MLLGVLTLWLTTLEEGISGIFALRWLSFQKFCGLSKCSGI